MELTTHISIEHKQPVASGNVLKIQFNNETHRQQDVSSALNIFMQNRIYPGSLSSFYALSPDFLSILETCMNVRDQCTDCANLSSLEKI